MTSGCQWPNEWSQCFASYMRSLRARSEQTSYGYRYMLARFFRRSAGGGPPKHPSAYTRADVEDFMYLPNAPHNRNAGMAPSPGSRNYRLAIVASFYAFAADYIPDGQAEPLFTGRLPTAGIESSKPTIAYHAFSIPEMERFFSVIPTDTVLGLRDRAIFLLYFWTARRKREVLDLCYGDIQRGIVIDGGVPREGWVYHFRGKGRKSIDDSAELPLPAKEAIDRYLEASGRLATIEKDDPLFLAVGSETGGGLALDPYKHLHSSTIHYAFHKYCTLAGIDAVRGLTVHSWRHTAAFHRRIAGQDIVEIKELLRHQSLEVTYRYVQSLTGTSDRGAALLTAKFGYLSKI